MALNSVPTVRPPTADELLNQDEEQPQTMQATSMEGSSLTPTGGGVQAPTPPELPGYETPEGAFLGERLGGEGGALESFARNTLTDPSRFDIPLVQQGTDLISREIADRRDEAMRQMDEYYAQRGILGSSTEAKSRAELLSDLEDQRMQRLYQLNMALAQTQGADRATAANIGTQIGGFQRNLGIDRLNEARYGAEFGLQAGGQQFGQQLASAEFGARQQMFGAELAQRESEFARQYGLNEREFMAQQDQFAEQMMLRYEQLGQQDEQFRLTLEDQQAARSVEAGLRNRALDLQEQGMSLDEAYRQAALQQEQELRNRALDLQQQGMAQEDAYRYAALEQDARFTERALELEAQGMSLDDAYRQAELELRQSLGQQELDLREYEITEEAQMQRLYAILQALGMGVDEETLQAIVGELGIGEGGDGGDSGKLEPEDPNIHDGGSGGGDDTVRIPTEEEYQVTDIGEGDYEATPLTTEDEQMIQLLYQYMQ